MAFRIEDSDKFFREQMEYWRQVDEFDGFDVDGISLPQGVPGLCPYDCQAEYVRYPHPALVKRYAILGLHRYNMSKGTNFVFDHLKKFNKSLNCLSSYYITLAACDPATTSLVTFQVGVAEKEYGSLKLSCFIARPKGTPDDGLSQDVGAVDGRLPYWPSDFNERKRFYVESELQDNDWIRLYLELALCTNDRWISESVLSQLQIVKVAIETSEDVEPPNERLEAKSATVYITFKGLVMARIGEIGEHVERKVIVRRVINERTGHVTLLGGFGFSIGEETKEVRPMSLPRFEWKLGERPSFDEQPPVTLSGPVNLFLFKIRGLKGDDLA